MVTQLWQVLFLVILNTVTVVPDPIPGPRRIGCQEEPTPANFDGNFRAQCRAKISTYGGGHFAKTPICNTLKKNGDCARIKVSNQMIRCCKWSNNVLDIDKVNQHAKFNHIAAYLAYTEQNNNAKQLLTDKTIIKYTAGKRLYALKIDETKIAGLQADTSQIFQAEGARKSKLKFNKGKKGQVRIKTSDIVEAINEDNSFDATEGIRVDSRVKVTGNILKEKDKPFSRVGTILGVLYDDSISICTGTLISDKLVLTAAHCLIENDIILAVGDIKFYPHRSKDLGGEQYSKAYPDDDSFTAVAVYFYYGYYRLQQLDHRDMPGKADWDIALIELSDSLLENYGYLAYAVPSDQTIREAINSINIGYPSSKGRGFMFKGFVFEAGNVKREIMGDDGLFEKYADATDTIRATEIHPMKIIDNKYANSEGQSGGSVFYWNANQYVAFAVVSAGRNRGFMKSNFYQTYFTRITYEKGLQIQDIINIGVDNYVHKIDSAAVELGINAPNARRNYENHMEVDFMDTYDNDVINATLFGLLIMDASLIGIGIIGLCGLLFCAVYFAKEIKSFMFIYQE